MAKKDSLNYIIRYVKGRLVKIKIGPSKRVPTSMGFKTLRQNTIKSGGKTIGNFTFGVPIKGAKKFKVEEIDIVDKAFQKKGIGTALFKRLEKMAKKTGVKKIEGTSLISPGAVKLRSKFDSDFFRRSDAGSMSKISKQRALDLLNKSRKNRPDIRAITRVKKKK